MAILTASFCMSSFMSALLMVTFLGGEVVGSAVSAGEGFNSSVFRRFPVRAPVVLLLAASVLIFFFAFSFFKFQSQKKRKRKERDSLSTNFQFATMGFLFWKLMKNGKLEMILSGDTLVNELKCVDCSFIYKIMICLPSKLITNIISPN